MYILIIKNYYPVENRPGFPDTYPLNSDLSSGQCYPPFEQLKPDLGSFYLKCRG